MINMYSNPIRPDDYYRRHQPMHTERYIDRATQSTMTFPPPRTSSAILIIYCKLNKGTDHTEWITDQQPVQILYITHVALVD